jgi:chaperone required for assembly of F1-ATPase
MTKTVKRFYQAASTSAGDDGFAVVLDGRPVKTTKTRAPLVVPSRPLAEAIAEEWAAQDETVRPDTMPLTALANTAIDMGEQRADLIAGLGRYAETDLLCYWAPDPPVLRDRQKTLWQPLLNWAAQQYDAHLRTTTGLLPIEQSPDAVRPLQQAIAALDRYRIAALSSAVAATGSLVVGLALLDRRLSGQDAFDIAEVEATFQIEQWGADHEAVARRERIHADLVAVESYLEALDAGRA